MSVAFRIASELSEKQIEADVASFFGYHSRHFGEFRLLDVNEQLTGADKKFDWRGTAYFFQFKKPIGLEPLARRPPGTSKQPLMRIRVFRHENDLDQEPYSVCFALRKPKRSEKALQHNVLRSLERPPASRAIYVCPLQLTSAAYTQSMRYAQELFDFPFWEVRPQWIRHGDYVAHAAERAPFLRGHACIVGCDARKILAHGARVRGFGCQTG